MISSRACQVGALLWLGVVTPAAAAPGGASPPASPAGGGSGASSLPGLSYAHGSWRSELVLPSSPLERVVICYRLVNADSSAQPFILQPVTAASIIHFDRPCAGEQDSAGKRACRPSRNSAPRATWNPCTQVDERHPLLMRQLLVIGIDATDVNTDRLKLLNINITTQQGSPLNPTPLRPSFAAPAGGAGKLALDHQPPPPPVYFLTWPNELPGDSIPTVSLSTIYTPTVPGGQWQPITFYPAGSVITSSRNDGHFYTALTGGVSGSAEPNLPVSPPAIVKDGTVVLSWRDSGTNPPGEIPQWKPNTSYSAGNLVTPIFKNKHYYTAMTPGVSGIIEPTFPVDGTTINDGAPLEWADSGSSLPSGTTARRWLPTTPYLLGDVVAPGNGHFYTAMQGGLSGPTSPTFEITSMKTKADGTVLWQDSGTSAPATVAPGQPADQIVSLLSLTLPQAHSLYYYNLSSGVVVGSVRNPSFVFRSSAPGSTTNVIQRIDGSLTIDPMLLFTFYLHPLDAESRWHKEDLIPGISFGFSLASPGSIFYLGGSSEILRNVQLVYGFTAAKVAKLAPQPATPGTSPATVQVFKKGTFIGVTYNISGFIQSLLGGGKGSP